MKSNTLTLSDGRQISIGRLKFKAAREFLKKFATIAATLSDDGKLTAESATSHFAAILPRIPDLIASSDELLAILVTNSAPLSREELDELDTLDALNLISACLEANWDVDTRTGFSGFMERIGVVVRKAA